MREPREVFEQRLKSMREEYETLIEGIQYCKFIVDQCISFFEFIRDHPYITSAKRWVGQKNGNFC